MSVDRTVNTLSGSRLPSVASSNASGTNPLQFIKTFAAALCDENVGLTTLIDRAATVNNVKQIILNTDFGVTEVESVSLDANRSPTFRGASAKQALLIGIKHGDTSTDKLARTCKTMFDGDSTITVISENCPGYAHNTSSDDTINATDDLFRQLPTSRVTFLDIRQASVMGVVEIPLIYRELMLQKIASLTYDDNSKQEIKRAMISLISGAHDSIGCLIASCDPNISHENRRVPANGYAISDVLLKYDDLTVKKWSTPWCDSIRNKIKGTLQTYTKMCRIVDDLLEFMLKIVLSEDFFFTYAEFGVIVATKKGVNLMRLFFLQ
eukprot:gene27431-33811_t